MSRCTGLIKYDVRTTVLSYLHRKPTPTRSGLVVPCGRPLTNSTGVLYLEYAPYKLYQTVVRAPFLSGIPRLCSSFGWPILADFGRFSKTLGRWPATKWPPLAGQPDIPPAPVSRRAALELHPLHPHDANGAMAWGILPSRHRHEVSFRACPDSGPKCPMTVSL